MNDDKRLDQLQARIERLETILARAWWEAECKGTVRPRCNDPWRDAYFPHSDKLPSSGGFTE